MSIKMMAHVWEVAPVNGSDLVVLLALADYGDDEGKNIYPSVPSIAKKARLSVDQARRVIHKLIDEDKVLELVTAGGWDGKRNRSNEYRITLPEGGTRADARGSRPREGGTRADASTPPRVDASTVPAPTRDDPLLEPPSTTTIEPPYNDVPEPPKEKGKSKSKKRGKSTPPHPMTDAIKDAYVKAVGHKLPPSAYTRVAPDAKFAAQQGVTPEEVERTYAIMKSEDYWTDKTIPLRLVLDRIANTKDTMRNRKEASNGQAANGERAGFTEEEIALVRKYRAEGRNDLATEVIKQANKRLPSVQR